MKKYIIENLKRQFPSEYENAAWIKQVNNFEILIKSVTGNYSMYDGLEQSIRQLPKDPRNMGKPWFKREFSRRLRNTMFHKRISQTELSQITGIAQPTISQYTSEKKMPDFYNIDRIAKALECSIKDLMYIDYNDYED